MTTQDWLNGMNGTGKREDATSTEDFDLGARIRANTGMLAFLDSLYFPSPANVEEAEKLKQQMELKIRLQKKIEAFKHQSESDKTLSSLVKKLANSPHFMKVGVDHGRGMDTAANPPIIAPRIPENTSPHSLIPGVVPEGFDDAEVDIPPFIPPRGRRLGTPETGAQREKLNVTPYDLVPFQEMTDAYTRVAEFGAKKYAPWNWTKGLSRAQLLSSLCRHVFAYYRGEDRDKETGLLHTDHILWNAVALVHNTHHDLEDGRRKEPKRDYYE